MAQGPSGLIVRNPSIHWDDEGLGQYRSYLYVRGSTWAACVLVCGGHHLLGTPETSRRGRSTRKARRALTSNPPGLPPCPCIDGWLLSPSPSVFSSLVKNSKTTLKSLSENNKRTSHKAVPSIRPSCDATTGLSSDFLHCKSFSFFSCRVNLMLMHCTMCLRHQIRAVTPPLPGGHTQPKAPWD